VDELEQLKKEVQSLRVLVDFFAKTVGQHFAVTYYPDFPANLKAAIEESEKVRNQK